MSKQRKPRQQKPRAILTTGEFRIVRGASGQWFHLRWRGYLPPNEEQSSRLVQAIGEAIVRRMARRKVRK